MPAKYSKTQRNERKIIRHIAESFIKQGFSITVNDGEDVVIAGATVSEVMKYSFETDQCILMVAKDEMGGRIVTGSIYFIFGNGNDGLDVVADYHTKLEREMAPINEWIEKLN